MYKKMIVLISAVLVLGLAGNALGFPCLTENETRVIDGTDEVADCLGRFVIQQNGIVRINSGSLTINAGDRVELCDNGPGNGDFEVLGGVVTINCDVSGSIDLGREPRVFIGCGEFRVSGVVHADVHFYDAGPGICERDEGGYHIWYGCPENCGPVDECPDDPEKTEPGQCGCGMPDTDTDSDGVADCIDQCPGEPDTDTDGDGTADCIDGCADDPDKIDPGICGCGVPDDDTDGDGALDCEEDCDDDPDKTEPGLCGCGQSDEDVDEDGVVCNDNCPDDVNADQADADEDGVGDVCDNCPCDANPGQEDTFGSDECGNACEEQELITVKVDLSCPGHAETKAGGDWQDFEWGNGCDGQKHDQRSFTSSEGYTFTAGDPGGGANLSTEGGDALHNTKLEHAIDHVWVQNHFRVSGLPAGDYEILVDGEQTSGTYNVTSTDPGTTYTIFDTTGGLDNFTMTGGGGGGEGGCTDDADEDGIEDCLDPCPDDPDPQCGVGCACIGDMDDSGQRSLADLDALVNLLVGAGPPFIVGCPDAVCYCADFDDSGQVSLADLDAMVNLLIAAGPPFIVPCE